MRFDCGTGSVRHGGQDGSREREVLELLAAGLTNRQVGEGLFISGNTAATHVSNILAKLEAETREEAVAKGRTPGTG